jgi:hypothetical protein
MDGEDDVDTMEDMEESERRKGFSDAANAYAIEIWDKGLRRDSLSQGLGYVGDCDDEDGEQVVYFSPSLTPLSDLSSLSGV